MELAESMVYAAWRLALLWIGSGLQVLGFVALIVGGVVLYRHIRNEWRLFKRQRVLDAWKASA